jgi:hypothetical protein
MPKSLQCMFLLVLLGCACPPDSPCRDQSAGQSNQTQRTLSPRERITDPAVMEFTIAAVEDDQNPVLRLTLRNTSIRTLWVNYRLALGLKEERWREVWLDAVHVATGETWDRTCITSRPAPEAFDYVVLTSGSEFSQLRSLRCYTYPNTGPWRITAHYRDPSVNPPSPPSSIPWFAGALTSNTIEMTMPEPPKKLEAPAAAEQ